LPSIGHPAVAVRNPALTPDYIDLVPDGIATPLHEESPLLTAAPASAGTELLPALAADDRWDVISGGLAAGLGALVPIATSPAVQSQTFVPKYALVLILMAAGLVPLVRLAISSRYAWRARVALGFLGVAVVSAIVSPSKLVGFFGLYLWGEGAIFLFALVAAWALGVTLGPLGRSWLFTGLLVGASVNAAAAVVQTMFQLNTQVADLSGFGLFDGTQADGMMGNPVHLEAILLGGLALILGRTCRRDWPAVLAPAALVALLAAGLECSSERLGVLLVVALMAYAVWAYRKRAFAYLGAIAVGFGGAYLGGAGARLSTRVATSTASTTFGLRFHAWVTGVRATLEHRLFLGFGPGEVRNAITLYQSRSFARRLAPGRYFTDLHNLFVNILVMTGIVGFLLFCVFLAGTSWKVRGAFAGFAVLTLGVELVEPMNMGVTPLAFLALGAALTASRGQPFDNGTIAPGRRARALVVLLCCVALLPGAVLVVGDGVEHSALQHFSLSDAKLANRLVPIWPETAAGLAEIYAYESVVEPHSQHEYLMLSLSAATAAAARDPSDNENWVLVVKGDISLGDLSVAWRDVARAIRDDPFSVHALSALGVLHAVEGDWSGAIAAYEEAQSIAPGNVLVAQGLAAAKRHDRSYFG